MPHEPRGRLVCPARELNIGDASFRAQLPGVIVYVKSGSGAEMREFTRFCDRHGLHAALAWESPDGQGDGYEVVGGIEQLDQLTGRGFVLSWHYRLNVQAPVVAGGSGSSESAGAVKAIRRAGLSKTAREAAYERDRRKAMHPARLAELEYREAKDGGNEHLAALNHPLR